MQPMSEERFLVMDATFEDAETLLRHATHSLVPVVDNAQDMHLQVGRL
jgi:CBS domain containing-hemolysin-like protein